MMIAKMREMMVSLTIKPVHPRSIFISSSQGVCAEVKKFR